jgi:hypothetical protein
VWSAPGTWSIAKQHVKACSASVSKAQAPTADEGRQHLLEHREPDSRLVAQARDRAPARVEVRLGAGGRGQRVVLAVEGAHPVPVAAIGAVAAEALDPRMLVGRHGLGRDLAADPVGLLGQDHVEPGPARGERGGAAAEAPADDHEVGGHLPRAARGPGRPQGRPEDRQDARPEERATSEGTHGDTRIPRPPLPGPGGSRRHADLVLGRRRWRRSPPDPV